MAPPPKFHKINVDGASSDDGRMSSIGVIIRNSKGDADAALSKTLSGQYTSLETEFIALENGVLLAKELELSKSFLNPIHSLPSKAYKLLILKEI